MPRTKTDYSKTIIYVIKCKNDDITEEYIGSTTNFTKRKYQHKSSCNNEKSKDYNQLKYKIIRENGGFASWFDDNCESNPSGKVALKKLVTESGMNEKLVKEGMMRKGFKYNKDLSKMGKDKFDKAYKGGFEGVLFVENEDIDTDQP